jgi:hypothetical protein
MQNHPTDISGPRGAFVCRIICFLLAVLGLAGQASPGFCEQQSLVLQIVRTAGEEVLWESPVKRGDSFTIDYRHSSDHTPVRDIFRIGDEGEIVLIEERFRWHGAGLESHPAAGHIDFPEGWTRVRMHRTLPRFLIRVGEVANHTLTFRGREIPLLSIAKGRDSLWIRVTRRADVR